MELIEKQGSPVPGEKAWKRARAVVLIEPPTPPPLSPPFSTGVLAGVVAEAAGPADRLSRGAASRRELGIQQQLKAGRVPHVIKQHEMDVAMP